MAVTDIIERDVSNDPLVPTPVAAQVIAEMPKQSAVLQLARRVPMSTKSARTPVLSVLPTAYFVSGDTGLKQTTKADWTNLELVAEELAVIVPIPEAYLDDAQIPVWDSVRPLMVEAFGAAIDAAILFGTNKPSTWGAAVVPHAIAAGNTVTAGAGDDLAQDIANLAKKVAEDGGNVNGFVAGPGFGWSLVGLRSADGVPIYTSGLAGSTPRGLYGFPIPEVATGAWDTGDATLIAGDWTKAIVGLRQDITFKLFTEGVISDDEGAVVLNLMQQDAVALRAVMRLGWQIANPVNRLNTDSGTRSYFGVLEPAAS
jgi:HK97 family phage major capsid protein